MEDGLDYTGMYRITWDGHTAPLVALSVVVFYDGHDLTAQIIPDPTSLAGDVLQWRLMATETLKDELSYLNRDLNQWLPGWNPAVSDFPLSIAGPATRQVAEHLRTGPFAYPVPVEVYDGVLAAGEVLEPINLSGDRIMTSDVLGSEKPPTLSDDQGRGRMSSEAGLAKIFVRHTPATYPSRERYSTEFNVVVTRPTGSNVANQWVGQPSDGEMRDFVNAVVEGVSISRKKSAPWGHETSATQAILGVQLGWIQDHFESKLRIYESSKSQSRGLEDTDKVFADLDFKGYSLFHVKDEVSLGRNCVQRGEWLTGRSFPSLYRVKPAGKYL